MTIPLNLSAVKCYDENTTEVLKDYLLTPFHTITVGPLFTLVVLTGLIANSIVAWIFTRKSMQIGMTVLLASLAINDNLYMVAQWLNQCPVAITYLATGDFQLSDPVTFGRFLSYPWQRIFYTCGIWIVLITSVERYLAICCPFRHTPLKAKRSAVIFTLITFVGSVAANIPAFMEFGIKKVVDDRDNSSSWKTVRSEMRHQISTYYTILRTVTHFIVPLVTIIILNCLSLKTIRNLRTTRAEITRQTNTEIQNGTMFLFYTGIFICCHSIPTMHYVLETFWEAWYIFCIQRVYLILKDIGHFLLLLNSAYSFLIYYFYGTKFRQTFHRMICRRGSSRYLFESGGRNKFDLSFGDGGSRQNSTRHNPVCQAGSYSPRSSGTSLNSVQLSIKKQRSLSAAGYNSCSKNSRNSLSLVQTNLLAVESLGTEMSGLPQSGSQDKNDKNATPCLNSNMRSRINSYSSVPTNHGELKSILR